MGATQQNVTGKKDKILGCQILNSTSQQNKQIAAIKSFHSKRAFHSSLHPQSQMSFQGGRSSIMVPSSQCLKLVSTPSSIGWASGNRSAIALNSGMPTIWKNPSCRGTSQFTICYPCSMHTASLAIQQIGKFVCSAVQMQSAHVSLCAKEVQSALQSV